MLLHCYLVAADRRRLEGNLQFRGGDSAAAAVRYRMALSFLDEDLLMQLEGPHLEKVEYTAHCLRIIIIDLPSSFTERTSLSIVFQAFSSTSMPHLHTQHDTGA